MDTPIVEIAQGRLKGTVGTDLNGKRFFSFLGIPFAKPPIGELRFKAPVPAEPWEGVRDATKEGPCCYQANTGSEDCLHLNVYTKTPERNNTPKPVMVWIHGGAFLLGSNSPSFYGPEYLMMEDIVLVVINYRLGILGFLALEDMSLEVPGNAALKDQVLALQWVQQNIAKFGGDPNNVTISGESAGSCSVHHLLLSPLTKGLFHKAILQSGCAVAPWALGQLNQKEFFEFIGIKGNETEALKVLRNMPVEELYGYQVKYLEGKGDALLILGPVVEKHNETAFITKEPITILISGDYNKVPLLVGYNTHEGMMFVANNILNQQEIDKDAYLPKVEDCVPPQMKLEKDSPVRLLIHQKLKDFYFNEENLLDKFSMETDYKFVAPTIASVKHHARTNPVYLYRMSLDAGLNFLKIIAKLDLPGTCHGDDLGYLFKTAMLPDFKIGSLEDISVRRFVTLWTNFVKYGNPTPDGNKLNVQWKPVEKDMLNFLDIGEELITGFNPDRERMAIWKGIFQLSPHTANLL